GTLAHRLHSEGRLSLETLERWGQDLLSAVSYLEQVAITHRDIKPENLGIAEVGPRKQLRLVLMDFSLSGAPADHLRVGTRPYLDPFLGTKFQRTRWDLAGDRFAAAMVLHEMAAGTLPFWGSRTTDPRFTEAEVTVDRDALPREIAAPLAELLEKALARDAGRRFDTADDLERAFTRIFQQLDQPAEDPQALANAAQLRAQATHATPVVSLGLSARATNVLERQNAQTVADFLALAPLAINTARGVGLDTRRELVDAQRDLRQRLGTTSHPPVKATTTAHDGVDLGLEQIVAQLLPTATTRNASSIDTLNRLLGLEPFDDASPWPSQTEVAASIDVTRARVGQVLAKARDGWRKLPAVTQLRDDLLSHLDALGGAATAGEVQRALQVDRGSGNVEQDRDLARAATRAAIETELAGPEARIAQRRTHDGRLLLASASSDPDERQRVLDFALRLGTIADELAAAETLAAPAEVTSRLSRLSPPMALATMPRDRLVALAAEASTTAAVSARLELHPRDMSPARALTLGRAALLGGDAISVPEIRRRIAARFPQVQPLPERPELDRLLRDGGFDLRWDEAIDAYVAPQRVALTGLTSYESSIGRVATATGTTLVRPTTDPKIVEAREFERRLKDAQRDGGMLSLMAYPQELSDAGTELRRLGVTVIDVDDLLIRQLHTEASDLGIPDWGIVLAADAQDRASVEWTNLGRLVDRAMPTIEDQIANTGGTVLLEHVGLLGRYGQLGLFDRLRARIMAGAPLRACWTLVPSDDQADRPAIDGHGIPVLTPNEYSRIPRPWLRNLHRAGAPGHA
ncbi:MAG: hypothetical protein WKF96_15065, partial [Solirubrobacteraceae bacterium]